MMGHLGVIGWPVLALLLAAASFGLPVGEIFGQTVGKSVGQTLSWTSFATPLVFAMCAIFAAFLGILRRIVSSSEVLFFTLLAGLAAAAPLLLLSMDLGPAPDRTTWTPGSGFWCFAAALVLLAGINVRLLAALAGSDAHGTWARYATPLVFGGWLLVFWQLLTQALDVPRVLLPAPSVIWHSLLGGFGVLASDFVQTVLHSVLIGLTVGSALGFGVGVLIDRSPFLQRGLLPLAALASAVPLVGIAPIMIMWFGFDWHSKAAVVVVMTFFPMLVNTLAGLTEAGHMERDLMRSYGASYWQTLWSLRIPAALPFVFNALKINSTLALIGAIVAEFFGSPTDGLGFRISTEAARLNMGLVWAAIGVAALTGSLLYGLFGWIERRATFWHPSIRTT